MPSSPTSALVQIINTTTGFPEWVQVDANIFGCGDLASRPATGDAVGDMYVVADSSSATYRIDFWDGSVWQGLTGASGGDVVGPGSSTDNAIARYDGITGKIIQDSLITISDTGSITIPVGETVDGRDISVDGTKLDTIETGAQVNTVDSVFGRTGVVVSAASDYDASQVDNDSSVAGAFVSDALNTLDAGKVDNSRILTAGAGLTGGGDLSADRTFDVGANADGSIIVNADDIQVGVLATDAQHGNRGGGSIHASATTSVAGFMSAADKTKLDGIEAGAQVNTVTSVFGRTGAVVAAVSDYDADQIDYDNTTSGLAATNAQDAIDEVEGRVDTLESNSGSTEVTATGNLSTTSSSPITATGMTITPGAGTYLVWFSTWGEHNSNKDEVAIGIAVDGSDISASQRQGGDTNQSDGQSIPLATHARVTITAGQTIQGRFWGIGGAVQINQRTLTILKSA